MKELIIWLDINKISFWQIDNEVIEINGFGRMFLADISEVQSIFRDKNGDSVFNLMENPDTLIEEGVFFVAFPFGRNWYYYDLRESFEFNILKYIGKRQPAVCNVPFVNLGVHTPYELLNGSGDLSDWTTKALYLGHSAIGICDRNTMAATLNLQKECAKAGIKHIFGYSLTLKHNDEKVDLKIYCQTQKGLDNLLRIQKEVMVDSYDNTISLKGLLKYAKGNAMVFGNLSSYWMYHNSLMVNQFQKAFDKVFYQVDLSEYKADRNDVKVLNATKQFFHNFYNPETDSFEIEPILICDCYYLDKEDARNKIILNKIATGAAHLQSNDQYFKDVDEHFELISSLFDPLSWDIEKLFARMCSHTVEIANGAQAKYHTGEMYTPNYMMLPDEIAKYRTKRRMFHVLLNVGLATKVSAEDREGYKKRLEEEIYIIESTKNVDYFLIQWDMVQEAKRRGIVTGIGRGSAGGSLVSYLLGIISIDPIKYDLLFSRFLVPERCGLNWVNEISVIGDDIEIPANETYAELVIDGSVFRFHKDAEFIVKRGEQEVKIYADQLKEGDDILLDQRDLLWTLEELKVNE